LADFYSKKADQVNTCSVDRVSTVTR